MLAHTGIAGKEAIMALINTSWLAARLPSAWKAADIQPKPKEPTRPRPISLMSCTAKTAERMVLIRLQWRLGPLQLHVFGFTRDMGISAEKSKATVIKAASPDYHSHTGHHAVLGQLIPVPQSVN